MGDTLKTLKNTKAPGRDEIANEMLKYGSISLVKQLTIFYNYITADGKIPRE